MRKPGKLQVVKVWVQLTNSLTKLDFHVNVDVDVDFLYFFSHHVCYLVGHSTLCELSEALTEWKSKKV